MNNPETVSVVIPTFNYGRFVCDAVEGALSQTVKPLEVIVIDDGSTDDTRERLKRYEGRIRYEFQANAGISAARNHGIRLSRGGWIALLDSDDIWHTQKLERQLALHRKHPEVRASGTDFIIFSNEEAVPANGTLYQHDPSFLTLSVTDLVFGEHFSGGSGALIHRDCFDKVGMFDETLRAVEDLEMWVRLGSEFNLGRVLEPLVFIRTHPNSLSTRASKMENFHRETIDKIFRDIPQLRDQTHLRRVAIARMHRGVAWMHYEAKNRTAAIRSLWRSFCACPTTSGRTKSGMRMRMAARFLLGKP